MQTYRRILALVDLSAKGEAVARRAFQLARAGNAALALAAVVDYTPGFESDHVPFMGPREFREAMLRDVSARLAAMRERVGAAGAEVLVGFGRAPRAVPDMARSWRPDLVLVGSHEGHGLERASDAEPLPFDVLTVQVGRPGLAGRLIHALTAAL